MDQRFSLDRTSFERFLATASLLQQLQKRAISLSSHVEDLAPQLTELSDTQQAIQAGILSVDAALLRISALALRLIPAQGAGVWVFSGDALLYRAGAGTASNDENLRNAISPSLANGNRPTDGRQGDNEVLHSPLVGSLLLAPIYQGQKIAGGFAVFSENTDCFNDRDAASTRLLSGLAAQALDKAANARFKQTVTLEREAVLHVIGALVPSLKDLVETKPYSELAAARGVDSAVREIRSASARSAWGSDLLIPDHDSQIEVKTEQVQDSVSVLQTHGTGASTKEDSNPPLMERVTLGLSVPCFEEWAKAAGVSDLEVISRPKQVASLPKVESAPVRDAAHVPASKVDELTRFAAEILEAAKHLRNRISALHLQASIVSWFQLCRASSTRMASFTAASLNSLVARASKITTLPVRSIPTKRFVTVTALVIVLTTLTVKIVVSQFRHRSAKTATPASHVDHVNVKTEKTLIADGSHKRVTDNATSAALGDLSRFEIPGLLRQARYGDDSATFLVGMAYETGRGVPQSCEKAAHWVKEAATAGDAAAEYNLSLRYRDGDGLPADSEQSQKWLQKAAAQNYPQALTTAGIQTEQAGAASSQP
ncbi:MAG TPA: hypothetical protein VGN39_15685 [Terriglobales bacterium]|nr:hypothetical protein [Terriglobales bacterium]